MIVEYRPSVEGLKNIYSKLLTLESNRFLHGRRGN
jgi:hypothetical protein